MLVKELQSFLKNSDPKAEVVLSKDGDGNGFHRLYLVQEAHCQIDKKLPWILACENEPFKGSKPCILLWPNS